MDARKDITTTAAQLEVGDDTLQVRVRAIGDHFMFVQTEATPLSLGAAVTLHFEKTDGSETYGLSGTIVHVAEAHPEGTARQVTGYTLHVTQPPELLEQEISVDLTDEPDDATPFPFPESAVAGAPMPPAGVQSHGSPQMMDAAMMPPMPPMPGVAPSTPMPHPLPMAGAPPMFAPPGYPRIPTPAASMPIPAMPPLPQAPLPQGVEDPGE